MHHSEDPDLRALAVTCYLDESATDGGTPTAVVGGLLINESHFFALDQKWRALLDEFELRPGLHIKDFGKHGRFSEMPAERRAEIFTRAVQIIKDHNICTMAVTLEHQLYQSIFPAGAKRTFSPYGLCFMACVVGNYTLAKSQNYAKRVAFVLDSGNPYADQVLLMHQALIERQAGGRFLNLGSLTFDKDDNVTALQAADLVCWAVRRRAARYPFMGGFEPIEEILTHQAHNEGPFPEASMRVILADLEAAHPGMAEEP